MEFVQELVIGAPRQKVWDFIWNVEEFAGCVPGVTQVEKVDDTHYKVKVEQKVSFLKASFNLQVEIQEQRPPEYIRTTGEGADSAIAASLRQKNEVTLEALSDSQTKMIIRSNVDVFGKLGSLGFSVIKSQANKIFADFAQRVKARLE
ncbi:MAG: SRPBCC domain-containing protein [Nitrospinota bacterium]